MQSHLSSIGSKLELVNFLLQPLVEVNSGSVATDCCPVTNLVSTNPVERLRGFRVEHFIRPPVQLDFEFQLPLNVACIIIRPDLPPESEMKLELAGSFHTVSTSTTLARICPSVVVGGSNVLMLENKSFKNQDVSIFAKDFVRYQVRGSFIGGGDNCLRGTEVMRQPLKLPNVLQSLRQLRLTVNRVNGPKPVALRSLEVWGTPSNSCSHIQLNLLQTSLTAVQLCSSAPSAGGVNLYSSRKSSPEHGTVAVQRDSITPNDLHRAYVDKALGCSDACYRETAMEVSQVDHCLLLQHKKECQPSTFRAERGPVFGVTGSGQSEMQEVFHIKARTSENKKSLKPQQGLSASHLPGCRHNNNIQDGGKPSCAQFNTLLPQGKNGNLSFSSKSEPTHNSGWSNDDENLPQSSCGLGSDISVHGKQQQRRQTQSAFISERDVPPEFLDKITYDVMQVPMLLPSGHCVDRSTLEKLSNSDALYGRPPTDPFTGTQMTVRAVCRCVSHCGIYCCEPQQRANFTKHGDIRFDDIMRLVR